MGLLGVRLCRCRGRNVAGLPHRHNVCLSRPRSESTVKSTGRCPAFTAWPGEEKGVGCDWRGVDIRLRGGYHVGSRSSTIVVGDGYPVYLTAVWIVAEERVSWENRLAISDLPWQPSWDSQRIRLLRTRQDGQRLSVWTRHLDVRQFLCLIAILFGVMVLLRLAIPNTATVALCATIFMPLASNVGIHPWVIGFILLLLGDLWFLPYQCPHYQQFNEIIRDKGIYNENAFLKFNLFMNLVRLGAVYASIPYWEVLGLL